MFWYGINVQNLGKNGVYKIEGATKKFKKPVPKGTFSGIITSQKVHQKSGLTVPLKYLLYSGTVPSKLKE